MNRRTRAIVCACLAAVGLIFISSGLAFAADRAEAVAYGWPLQDGVGTEWIGYGLQPAHPIEGKRFMSSGVYLLCAEGTKVLAVADGTVLAIVYPTYDRLGTQVVVRHADGVCTYYSSLVVGESLTTGQQVVRGQTLGTVRLNQDYGKSFLFIEFTISKDLTRAGVIWKGEIDEELKLANEANPLCNPAFFLDTKLRQGRRFSASELLKS